MSRNLKKLALGIALVVVFASFGLAGCSSDVSQNPSSSAGQQPPASSGEQSIDQPAQQQQPSSSGQQPSDSPAQQPPGASNMAAVLDRAAEILGISAEDFTIAFQKAMSEGGAFGSGGQGQPPAPPSGQQGQPPTSPSGQQGQPPAPPAGQEMPQSQFMTEVYAKMAVELNVSADDVAEAMTQAETELQQ